MQTMFQCLFCLFFCHSGFFPSLICTKNGETFELKHRRLRVSIHVMSRISPVTVSVDLEAARAPGSNTFIKNLVFKALKRLKDQNV